MLLSTDKSVKYMKTKINQSVKYMENKNKLEKKFTEVDLCLHSYMYDSTDFKTVQEFFQHISDQTDGLLDDYDLTDIREAFVRQYTGWVGYWTNEVEAAYNQVFACQH